MRYKIENKESPVIINNTEKNYIIKKTEDVIELRFDEDNQAFFARIKNPSEHTKYLYENNRLAIALCKMNCGKETLHGHWCKNETFINPETGDEENLPSSFVKRNKHPRWSRCGLNIAPVLNSLDDEYEIDITQTQKINGETYKIGIEDFYPEPHRTVGRDWSNKWYNSVKAVLLSSPMDLTDGIGSNVSGCRAYRTMCKRIKIEYDSENEMIIHRKKHGKDNHYYEYYHCYANVMQNNRTFTITLTDIGTKIQEALNNKNAWIGFEVEDTSKAVIHSGSYIGSSKLAHNGNNWKEFSDDPESTEYKSRRYTYRLSQKNICPYSTRELVGKKTFSITIPEEYYFGLSSGICGLYKMMIKHGDEEDIIRYPKIVFGIDTNSGRRVWTYQTNLELVCLGSL